MTIPRLDPNIGIVLLGLFMMAVGLGMRPDADAQTASPVSDATSGDSSGPGAACQQLFERVSPYETTGAHQGVAEASSDSPGFTVRRWADGDDGLQSLQVEYACAFDSADGAPLSLEITGYYH